MEGAKVLMIGPSINGNSVVRRERSPSFELARATTLVALVLRLKLPIGQAQPWPCDSEVFAN